MTLIKAKAATFVLITNLLDNETWPAHAVLREYKEQQTVERKFEILKDPKLLDAIFLKKPERIQALSMILVTAVLIYSIIERRVRRALKEANRGFDTSYRGVLTNPTGSVLLSLLTNRIYTIKFSENGVTKRYVSKPDKIAERRVLIFKKVYGKIGFLLVKGAKRRLKPKKKLKQKFMIIITTLMTRRQDSLRMKNIV